MSVKLFFLGTGGGRFVTSTQALATGGWVLEMSGHMLHIDPGPGALVRAKQHGINLNKLTGLVVSHCHPDHTTDAQVVIEAMTRGTTKRKGTLITNKTVISGLGSKFIPSISPYHVNLLERCCILKPGKNIVFDELKVTATPTKHGDPNGLGFVFKGSTSIGYVGDGEYFRGQEKFFTGCSCLVLNVLRPRGKEWPKHMNSRGALKIIRAVKPELAILQHFGFLMLGDVVEREKKWIEKESGVKTVAARDGQAINI